jgi:hypothetical protein
MILDDIPVFWVYTHYIPWYYYCIPIIYITMIIMIIIIYHIDIEVPFRVFFQPIPADVCCPFLLMFGSSSQYI